MTRKNRPSWRLIDTGPLPGAENMAIDAALLDCFDPETSLPALRLYGWEPPAFSHGKFQDPAETLSLELCAAAGVPVVRRITGGGLLYHAEELTYSLVCPTGFVAAAPGVKNGFLYLTAFLMDFYRRLGLPALHAIDHYNGEKQLGGRSALCFAGTERCDILINGRKIGGNAQRRIREVIFQHGSIPLRQMAAASLPYLRAPAPEIVAGTTSLADEDIRIDRTALAGILAAAFAATFAIEFTATPLSEAERHAAAQHIQKFA